MRNKSFLKKIEASKLLLENDVKLKIKKKTKKLKGTTVDFNNFPEEDSDDDSEGEPEPVKKQPWGTSTRNKKSVKKPPQPVKIVHAKYDTPVFF